MNMETERFEALIDAILAIIITIIVMDIPLPETTNITSLLQLYPDFIAYTISFLICFFVWYYHHNLFNIVNKLNSTITWTSAMMIILVGLLPHTTTMLANNYYSFTAQAIFGLLFYITIINAFLVEKLLIKTDKANIALQVVAKNRKKFTQKIIIIIIITYILAYLYYPPTIIIGCLITLTLNYLPKDKIRLPR